MSKQPGFTVKQKTTTSAVVNGQEISLTDFRAYLPYTTTFSCLAVSHGRPPVSTQCFHRKCLLMPPAIRSRREAKCKSLRLVVGSIAISRRIK